MTNLTPLYLDDLAVGDRFTSRSYELTLDSLLEFANLYDPQPFHLDPQAAQATVFNGLAASGWQTAGITMRLWSECFPVVNGLIGLESQVSWPMPTRAGDQLHVELCITEIKPSASKPEMGIVTYQSETKNQHDQVVQKNTTKIVVFRRATAAD